VVEVNAKEETRREEIKKKLEPKHTPTSVPKAEAPNLEAQKPRAEIGTSAKITEGRLPVLQPPQLKPPMLRPKIPKITIQELKEGKEAEVPSLKASFQTKLRGEVKPKIPKVSVIEVSRSGELRIPIKKLPKKEIKAFLKPLRTSVIGKPEVKAPVLKLPEARIETSPMATKPIKLKKVLPKKEIKVVEGQTMATKPIKPSESETCTQKRSKPETYYKSFEELYENLDPIRKQMLREIMKELLKEEIKVVEGQTMATVRETSKSFGEEILLPPLFEELSSVAESARRPVCIVLSKREGDSFAISVAMVCREIYRIVKGGKPAPRWISKGLKDEIERELRAESMVFIVDDSKCEFLPELGKIRSCRELVEKIDVEKVFDRLREFFSQDFGFVIFHVNERWAGQFANLLKKRVGKFVNIVEIRAPHLSSQAKEILARACWGFVKGEGETFDEMFGHCEKKFSEELEKAKKDVELTHYVEWDKSASPEHESMKVVVVDFLARELGVKDRRETVEMLERGKIKTEYELDGGRVDIYVPSQQRFVEVETFYGTGDPIHKLDKETLHKYLLKYRGTACRVDVVLLTGIQALLYARRLIKLAELYRKREGLEVNFYVPNLEERRLVPLKEMLQLLRGSVGSSKQVWLTEDEVEMLCKKILFLDEFLGTVSESMAYGGKNRARLAGYGISYLL
jgi:hypothetical protein